MNELYIKDDGKDIRIELNNQDITAGVSEYIISRNSKKKGLANLKLEMSVRIKEIEISSKNANLK